MATIVARHYRYNGGWLGARLGRGSAGGWGVTDGTAVLPALRAVLDTLASLRGALA